ncbi:Uncharacterised protein [Yersinia intermedia]|nr:Uncharacterised protein [Yersinia intermedia]
MELENIILSSIFISGIIELIIKYFIRNRKIERRGETPPLRLLAKCPRRREQVDRKDTGFPA